MTTRANRALVLVPLGMVACVEVMEPPEPTVQVEVPYGPKVFLADRTLNDKNPPINCRRYGKISVTQTSSLAPPVVRVGGKPIEDERAAVNCHVRVQPGELQVDVIETSNDLFQLCVDSGFCEKPIPSKVEKAPLCNDVDNFGSCPVLSVQHLEAARFCEFLGRRLPSSIEHVIMRQQNQPQVPEKIEDFPTGDRPPNDCTSAVLEDCRKPRPMTIGPSATTGAARQDRTTQGVYDLIGNASEWAADLLPERRGAADGLPWFCHRAIPATDIEAGKPCPADEACVFGDYDPDGAAGPLPFATYPVCYAPSKRLGSTTVPTLQISNGNEGALFGGNFNTSTPTTTDVGIFARVKVSDPDADPAEATQGFRCVGMSGDPQPITGELGPTPDRPVLPDAGVVAPDAVVHPDAEVPDSGVADQGFVDSGPPADTGPADTGVLTPCEQYCDAAAANCTGPQTMYPDRVSCLTTCAAFPATGMPGDAQGNTVQCRTHHAGMAATNAAVHCPHASASGGGACGDRCDGYCDQVMVNCDASNGGYADRGHCLAICAAFPTGTFTDTATNSVECRTHHASYPAVGDAAMHCPAASVHGNDVCGARCDGYCDQAMTNCTGGDAIFGDVGTCRTACGSYPVAGTATATTGDSVECRTHHASFTATATTTQTASVSCSRASPGGGDACL